MKIIESFPDGLVLTSLFWDCECERDYIHPKAQTPCLVCGAERDSQPDSRVSEVLLLCSQLLTINQRKIFDTAIGHPPSR